MKKWILVALFLILGNDIVLDTVAADCHDLTAPICHSCACPHLVNNAESGVQRIVPRQQHFVRAPAELPDFLFDKSVFHPPKVLS